MSWRKQILLALAAAAPVIALAAISGATAGSQLTRGWNNVAYMGPTQPPSEALSSIDGEYDSVYRWNPAEGVYDFYSPDTPDFVNSLASLNTGDAIWLDVTSNTAQLATAGLTGVLSVPASTFVPASDLALYEKSFNELWPIGADDASKRYFAPVILPNGATITSMTAAFETSGGGVVQLRLDYTPITNGSASGQIYKLVEVLSTSGSSPQTANAFSHTVDNGSNVYFLVVDLIGGPGAKLRGVSIAYTGG